MIVVLVDGVEFSFVKYLAIVGNSNLVRVADSTFIDASQNNVLHRKKGD